MNRFFSLLVIPLILLLLQTSCDNKDELNTFKNVQMFAGEEIVEKEGDSQSHYRLDNKDINLSLINETITITLHNNFLLDDNLLLYFTFIDTARSDMLPIPDDLSFRVGDQIILPAGHLGADYIIKKSFGNFVFNISSEQKEILLSQGLDINFNHITYNPLDIRANNVQAEGKWQYNLPISIY